MIRRALAAKLRGFSAATGRRELARREDRDWSEAGFTLLELLIVILLISIFLTFASVNWEVVAKKGVDAFVESFSIRVSLIREEAISSYESRVIEFDVTEGKIRVGTVDEKSGFLETGQIPLAEGYRIKDVVINGRPVPIGKCYMTFHAGGMVDRVVLHLEGENDLYSLFVNPLTARVTGEAGYVEETGLKDRHNAS